MVHILQMCKFIRKTKNVYIIKPNVKYSIKEPFNIKLNVVYYTNKSNVVIITNEPVYDKSNNVYTTKEQFRDKLNVV